MDIDLGLLFVSIIGLSLSPEASFSPLRPSGGLTLVQKLAADLWQHWPLLQLSHLQPALLRCRPSAVCAEPTLVQYRVFVHSATATKVTSRGHAWRHRTLQTLLTWSPASYCSQLSSPNLANTAHVKSSKLLFTVMTVLGTAELQVLSLSTAEVMRDVTESTNYR